MLGVYCATLEQTGLAQWYLSLPEVGMGLCVGEVGRPRWLALTEGTLS